MALSQAALRARALREFAIIGVDTSTYDDIIADGLRLFVQRMDLPIISASLSVTVSEGPYTIPATIRKIVDVRDNASTHASVKWSEDTTAGKLTLQDAPSAAGTYTVYGTPKEVVTNVAAIITATSEDMYPVLWQFIRAAAHAAQNSEHAERHLALAYQMALEERKSANRLLSMDYITAQMKDTTGSIVADDGNADGVEEDINDFLESDL
jgi:hypothetical protein